MVALVNIATLFHQELGGFETANVCGDQEGRGQDLSILASQTRQSDNLRTKQRASRGRLDRRHDETLTLFAASMSAPRCTSSFTTSMCLYSTAISNGVARTTLRGSTSAPASSRACAHATWPLQASSVSHAGKTRHCKRQLTFDWPNATACTGPESRPGQRGRCIEGDSEDTPSDLSRRPNAMACSHSRRFATVLLSLVL